MKCEKCGLEMMVQSRQKDSLYFICVNPKCDHCKNAVVVEQKVTVHRARGE